MISLTPAKEHLQARTYRTRTLPEQEMNARAGKVATLAGIYEDIKTEINS
jgi:hypothetical protein